MKIWVSNETRRETPRLPFKKIAEAIMPRDYDLSIVFVGPAKMRLLNRHYRHKDKTTNVLSFELSKKTGEIYLSEQIAEKEISVFKRTLKKHLASLLIHAMFHLKGFTHGGTMERSERRVRRIFKIG